MRAWEDWPHLDDPYRRKVAATICDSGAGVSGLWPPTALAPDLPLAYAQVIKE